ncbi:hypothetical protein PQC07_gp006 [Aeromonas phage D3]|uniref:Uncharacterized protein n=2 Tax=Ludhianavirus TaxID=3044751 RepID=A0A514TVH1_9CAUD|nr:hypothetical protein PQC07_gp006 [Aeromonas phage D3]YP_010668754.1 hypothetical protein PQC08_gp006 [Aeromonas phage D6]QDJ97004.1 hypothetical protein D3_0006 [Aeromonas phage D3]QDJ97433.1 hypothetical protein D6_0006 [Aeromonas phage D6]QEP52310.1 hypothetical protein D9_0103 [Aeromonas phage D9]
MEVGRSDGFRLEPLTYLLSAYYSLDPDKVFGRIYNREVSE